MRKAENRVTFDPKNGKTFIDFYLLNYLYKGSHSKHIATMYKFFGSKSSYHRLLSPDKCCIMPLDPLCLQTRLRMASKNPGCTP